MHLSLMAVALNNSSSERTAGTLTQSLHRHDRSATEAIAAPIPEQKRVFVCRALGLEWHEPARISNHAPTPLPLVGCTSSLLPRRGREKQLRTTLQDLRRVAAIQYRPCTPEWAG